MSDTLNDEPIKLRDSAATRAAILDAARLVFTQKGYDGAGVREIAADAGCTAALVNRYFGSKEQLFAEVVAGGLEMDALFDVPRELFAETLAHHMINKQKEPETCDVMLVIARSTTNKNALKIVRQEIEARFATRLENYLAGENKKVRAALIVSTISGFDMSRHIVGITGMEKENDAVIGRLLAQTIQHYVNLNE